ncbi:hypothetical protein NHX12_018408 [Muraenolepis orangiensis]|uniref:Cyclic AMP-dependent transcription factor ATF-4 n=1 Tax=Muraenolepis orangiensis TaxID=630683 RepID=A0A9Q0EZQ6_9TELE|nr:hypothetical protein NHX12_018408 [Muraenolepis orangiensis]
MALKTLLASEAVGALLGPSFLPADPMVPLLDEEEALSPSSSLQGSLPASPSSSFSSSLSPYQTLCSSPLSSFSPPASPLSAPSKVGPDSLSFPWLDTAQLLDADRDDSFSGMDWMAEKIDLSDFDLDSLMDSCSSDQPASSPEDLIATLDSHMDLVLHPFDSPVSAQLDALTLLPDLPLELPAPTSTVSPAEEVVVKSEPLSPPPSYLALGSEVDVLGGDKTTLATTSLMAPPPGGSTTTSFLVSLTPAGPYVMLLTAKAELGLVSLPESPVDQSCSPAYQASSPVDQASSMVDQALSSPTYQASSSDCDSDSGIESASGSPSRVSSPSSSAGSSRTKPYSRPGAGRAKSASGGGPPRVVEKKLKKMEQNKTAATRYRQKKRVEQEVLSVECGELETRNNELAEKVEALSREIKYLKDLMEEVRTARHRRSKAASDTSLTPR